MNTQNIQHHAPQNTDAIFEILPPPILMERDVEPKKQALQIISWTPTGMFVVKHMTPGGGFAPLSRTVRTLRASSLGRPCQSALWFSMCGQPAVFEDTALNIFAVGKVMEPLVLSWMTSQQGWEVRANNNDQEGVIACVDGGLIVGHIDALVRHPLLTQNRWAVADVKTMNQKWFTTWLENGTQKVKPEYFVQLQIYSHIYGQFFNNEECDTHHMQEMVLSAVHKDTSRFIPEIIPFSSTFWDTYVRPVAEHIFQMDVFPAPSQAHEETTVKKSDCFFCSHKEACEEKSHALSGGNISDASTSIPKLPLQATPETVIDILATTYELYGPDMERIFPQHTLDKIFEENVSSQQKNQEIDGHDSFGQQKLFSLNNEIGEKTVGHAHSTENEMNDNFPHSMDIPF